MRLFCGPVTVFALALSKKEWKKKVGKYETFKNNASFDVSAASFLLVLFFPPLSLFFFFFTVKIAILESSCRPC